MFETWEKCLEFSKRFENILGFDHLISLLMGLKTLNLKIPARIQYRSQPVDVTDSSKGKNWYYFLSWEKFFILVAACDSPIFLITSMQTAVTVEYFSLDVVLKHLVGNSFFYFVAADSTQGRQ